MGGDPSDRQARLAAALRQNLHRRKRQARGQEAAPDEGVGAGEAEGGCPDARAGEGANGDGERAKVTPADPAATAREAEALLDAHADAAGHSVRAEPYAYEIRLGSEVAGRLTARLVNGWMMVALLAVRDGARGKGLGRALMAQIEAKAREAGAEGVAVDTYAFQAPGFYARLGYEEAMRLPGVDPALTRIFFVKRLSDRAP